MKEEILDYLILGGYSFSETSEEFEISIAEVRAIYRDYLNGE